MFSARTGRLAIASGVLCATVLAGEASARPVGPWSAAREWDEQMLAAIRIDKPRPPIHARNLYHVSAAMWDAWAAYSPSADQVFHHERQTAANVEAARAEAISFAAYRVTRWRYQFSAGAAATLAALDAKFLALGYDKNNFDTASNTPAALGNRIYLTIQSFGFTDGSNEPSYAATNFYYPVNPPLILALPDTFTMYNANRWQPLAFEFFINQNGIPEGAITQTFVCPHWAAVTPFAIKRPPANPPVPPAQDFRVYYDPGAPPQLGGVGDDEFKAGFLANIRDSSLLDPSDGVMMDISPAAKHNNSLGADDGVGYPINPVTGLPYATNVVKRADYARILAEFWADGPNSETPPGHWNTLGNKVSDDPLTVLRIGGTGPVVNRLEWDVKMYLAVNGAVHDAAVACWGVKGKYDWVRPISAIRFMCSQGQCSDLAQAHYNQSGIPLSSGLVEMITAASCAPGQRHAALADHIGDVAVYSWKGQPAIPATQIGGVGWILASRWQPYQAKTFVTPPFAGYYSGHSTYSRSAAEVLAGFTGSPYFPGGLGTYNFLPGFLSFETGPSLPMQLQWATYYDAADEAGISRRYGGIHPRADDFPGRRSGWRVGKLAYAKAQKFYQGRITCPADFNGSGANTIGDLYGFLGVWFPTVGLTGPGFISDINEDEAVSTQDLLQFLTAYFAGCTH